MRIYPTGSSPELMHISFPNKYGAAQSEAHNAACITCARSNFMQPLGASYKNQRQC